jgi:hypothetical protein
MLDKHEQAIRERAYRIWVREGCPEGRDLIHWLEAEAEIREEAGVYDDARVVRSWAEVAAP